MSVLEDLPIGKMLLHPTALWVCFCPVNSGSSQTCILWQQTCSDRQRL